MVVRSKVRIIAATATRLRRPEAAELAPRYLPAWRELRRELEGCQGLRVLARRYRQKPRAYPRRLEKLLKSALPHQKISELHLHVVEEGISKARQEGREDEKCRKSMRKNFIP